MDTYYDEYIKHVITDVRMSYYDGSEKILEETCKKECHVCKLCNYATSNLTVYEGISRHLYSVHCPDGFYYDAEHHNIVCKLCHFVEYDLGRAKQHNFIHEHFDNVLPAERKAFRYACRTCRTELYMNQCSTGLERSSFGRHVKLHETEKQRVIMFKALINKGFDVYCAQWITQRAYPIQQFV